MIYDSQTLKNIYSSYLNINQKISIEIKNKKFLRIKRGIFTDNLKVDAPVIANICYEPSYISFEYALYYYGLIPEKVSVYTSACFNKKNNKLYITDGAIFEYRSIPNAAYSFGITFLKNESDMTYKIATKEKALCDMLYVKYPVRSKKKLKVLLFEDLRIDELEFFKLDFKFIEEIAPYYHSNTINTLVKFIKEKAHDSFN